jgi:protein-arginine kinase activator protein McsA
MRSRQTDGLRTGGHAFDPVTHVCAQCEMTRKQFLDAGKPKCAGRPSEAERFLIDGEPDSKGG